MPNSNQNPNQNQDPNPNHGQNHNLNRDQSQGQGQEKSYQQKHSCSRPWSWSPPEDVVEALNTFTTGRFPREIGYKFDKGFVRNRYVFSAKHMVEELGRVEKDFFMSVYSFEDIPTHRKPWDRSKVVIDRLFFDFDCKDSLTPALRDAKKLIRALSVPPIVVFSGSKGFHIHVLFKPVKVDPKTIKVAGTKIVEKLKLKTCDVQVFEVARLCRVPFSIHSSTGLRTTIINPYRFMKMRSRDIFRFVKQGKWDFPEYEYDEDVGEMLTLADAILYEEEVEKKRLEMEMRSGVGGIETGGPADEVLVPDPDGGYRICSRIGEGRKKRIEYYTKILMKHGRLSADQQIRAKHTKSDWVAKYGKNPGAVEHIARVHLILMMIEEGYSDEEIHKVFKYAKDYSYERTQYFIDYNRKWLARRVNSQR